MAGMSRESYYRDHWIEVEPERVESYDQMFRWRPEMAPLLAPAEIEAGQTVVDYGCGPGQLALELARRVGPSGLVHGVDINATFLERARKHAQDEGLSQRTEFHQVEEDRIPLPDGNVDRVICKNVLEYVEDPDAVLREFHRVLRPGGIAHAIDSDWGMLALEPIGAERTAELMGAAQIAFRTPYIGRELYSRMRDGGFAEVRAQVLAGPDLAGRALPVIHHMAQYARDSGRVPGAEIDAFLADVEAAIEKERYLLVLPQFLVTGIA